MTTTTAVGTDTARVINEFNDALNRHDVDAVMALMTDDCVFENTSPGPDGERFVGQRAIRAFWMRMLANSPRARFDAEEIIVCGDRCIVQWRYSWGKATSAGSTSSASATARLPRSSPTSKAETPGRRGCRSSPAAKERTLR